MLLVLLMLLPAVAAADSDAPAKSALQYFHGAGIQTRVSATADRCADNDPFTLHTHPSEPHSKKKLHWLERIETNR